MTSEEYEEFRETLLTSLTEGGFTAAVCWGALASGLVAIVEYGLTAPSGHVEISYSMFVAGIVAAVIFGGSRDVATKAGAYAAGIPVLVLGPISQVLLVGNGTIGGSVEWLLVANAFLLVVALPIVTLFSAVVGGITAHVTHWAIEKAFDRDAPDPDPGA